MLFSIRSVLWVSVGVVSWFLPRAVGLASLPACLWTVLARAPSQPARRFVPHSRACGSCCSASPAGLAPVPFARDSRSPSRALLHDVWRSACWLRCPWCPTAAASRMWPRLILDLHPIIIVCSPGRSIRAPAGVPCPHLRPRQRCLRFIPALAGLGVIEVWLGLPAWGRLGTSWRHIRILRRLAAVSAVSRFASLIRTRSITSRAMRSAV